MLTYLVSLFPSIVPYVLLPPRFSITSSHSVSFVPILSTSPLVYPSCTSTLSLMTMISFLLFSLLELLVHWSYLFLVRCDLLSLTMIIMSLSMVSWSCCPVILPILPYPCHYLSLWFPYIVSLEQWNHCHHGHCFCFYYESCFQFHSQCLHSSKWLTSSFYPSLKHLPVFMLRLSSIMLSRLLPGVDKLSFESYVGYSSLLAHSSYYVLLLSWSLNLPMAQIISSSLPDMK